MDYDETDLAQRYDLARQMPEQTLHLWLDIIGRYVSSGKPRVILDIGCGTGRFSAGLADKFDADVIAIDPSETMLARARAAIIHPRVIFRQGQAEHLPIDDASVDLVYLSMVYHHLNNPAIAVLEFSRVLGPNGVLCIRNSTLDLLNRVPYLKFFPEAKSFNRKRIPAQSNLIKTVCTNGFSLIKHEIVEQQFAASLEEYTNKIAHRGLSDLAALTDAEFKTGMRRMKEAVLKNEMSGPVLELIDLFVFKKAQNQ